MSDRRDFLQTLLATALTTGAAGMLPTTIEAHASAGPGGDDAAPQTGAAAKTISSRIVQRQLLPAPFEGLDAAIIEVTIPPGVESRPHKHSGFVLGYVIEGDFRFGTNGETPRTVRAGETFYEAPGATHSTAASARPDRPVKLLAIIIGKQGAQVTTYEQ